MLVNSDNTAFYFLNTYKGSWDIEDTRHLVNIIVGILFLQKDLQNPLIKVYLHEERKNDFNMLINLFGINQQSVQIFLYSKLFENLQIEDKDNTFLFISTHGLKNIGICSPDEMFNPINFFNNINSIQNTKNVFIFFGQCYAGLYKDIPVINSNIHTYLFGCSNVYGGFSSKTVFDDTKDPTINNVNNKLETLSDKYPKIKDLSLLLFNVFKNFNFLLNKELNNKLISDFFTKLKSAYADAHLINELKDDNFRLKIKDECEQIQNEIDDLCKNNYDNEKYFELFNKKQEKEDLISEIDNIYKDKHYYNFIKDDIKKNGRLRITKTHNGPFMVVDVEDLFLNKLFPSIPMIWSSNNFIWYKNY